MSRRPSNAEDGPFRADQLKSGDRYELDRGHPIYCAPTGHRGAKANLVGAEVLDTDPIVEEAGIDPGYAPDPKVLRAPDVAVGNVGDHAGWGKGAPVLALEYADVGQDEDALAEKIRDLHAHGTKVVWVARLVGPRRVEIHEPNREARVVGSGAVLVAPGILANPVPVDALFDRRAAHEATFRNLLQRRGFASLDEVRGEGREEGREEGRAAMRATLRDVLRARGLSTTEAHLARIDAADTATLARWIAQAAVAAAIDAVFD